MGPPMSAPFLYLPVRPLSDAQIVDLLASHDICATRAHASNAPALGESLPEWLRGALNAGASDSSRCFLASCGREHAVIECFARAEWADDSELSMFFQRYPDADSIILVSATADHFRRKIHRLIAKPDTPPT